MTARPAPRRSLPDTALGVLAEIDEILCDILQPETKGANISLWGRARLRLLDAQPGVPSKPAGNGEPSSGRLVFTHAGARASSSTVESAAERHLEHGPGWEHNALERFDTLPILLCDEMERLAGSVGWVLMKPVPSGLRRLVWCRYVLRRIIAEGNPQKRGCEKAHAYAVELADIVDRWSGRSQVKVAETKRLADDASGMWCRSCLRIGHLTPRDKDNRYPKDGLCRKCGDFNAHHGYMPTPRILEVFRNPGPRNRLTPTMIDQERPRKKRKK